MDATAHFYSAPTGFAPFSGSRRQVGGGIFGSLARAIVPKLKDFGKAAARRAFSAATNVASDIAQGSSIGDAFKNRGKEFLKESVADGINRIAGQKRPASLLIAPPPPKKVRADSNPPGRKRRKGKGLF